MDWQLPLTLTVLLSACSYLAWRGWRVWRAERTGCAGSCGCAKTNASEAQPPTGGFIPAEQLTIRKSSGERRGVSPT